MILFDSNILIYSYQTEYVYLRKLIFANNVLVYVSSISKLETLGYAKITKEENKYFNGLFEAINILPIDSSVIDVAIEIKQQKRISIGDSIVAATALRHNLTIYTRNINDYKNIKNLKLINPIK